MRTRNVILSIIAVVLCALVLMGSDSCDNSTTLTNQRIASAETRTQAMARAEALYPSPRMENFPVREVLVEYARRIDMVNHPWYGYLLNENGTIFAYFVSKTIPVSTNAFLSSTESTYGSEGRVVLTLPALEGIYYNGAGSNGSGGWVFVDVVTNAMCVVYGVSLFFVDAPLILETEPMLIRVQ